MIFTPNQKSSCVTGRQKICNRHPNSSCPLTTEGGVLKGGFFCIPISEIAPQENDEPQLELDR
jgi:hypothetical protein